MFTQSTEIRIQLFDTFLMRLDAVALESLM